MTSFKVKKSAIMKNPRHDTDNNVLYHDDIVIRIIQKMRKLNNRLIYYCEDECPEFSNPSPTVMKFEEKVSKGSRPS